MHQGIVQKNGIVDISQFLDDRQISRVSGSDDGLHLDNYNPGNFEWWYFDIHDPEADCILKIVVHLGTDPLRRKFYPQIALSLYTTDVQKTFTQTYHLDEFTAAHDSCNLQIADNFNCFSKDNDYRIWIDIPEFKAEFIFQSRLPAWKPLGSQLTFEKRKKTAAFGWIIPVPRATVTGSYTINGHTNELKDANGYHDHNFWKVNLSQKLYMDSVISGWYWGRFYTADHTVIFMNTDFRSKQLRSLYISDREQLIHSSNNVVQFHIDEQKSDDRLKYTYPSRATISSLTKPDTYKLSLDTKKIIDYKDLLSGMNPLIAFLIKTFVSKPYYLSFRTECRLTYEDRTMRATGILEKMSFR